MHKKFLKYAKKKHISGEDYCLLGLKNMVKMQLFSVFLIACLDY